MAFELGVAAFNTVNGASVLVQILDADNSTVPSSRPDGRLQHNRHPNVLLRYAAANLSTTDTRMLKLPEQLTPVKDVQVGMRDVHACVQKLSSDARELKTHANATSAAGQEAAAEPFRMAMHRFADTAVVEVNRLTAALEIGDSESACA